MATSLSYKGAQNAWASVAASQTDSSLVAAVPGRRIVVLAVVINEGDTTASSVTFNSKSAGAGTPIYPTVKYPPNGGTVLKYNKNGWFATNSGEGLTVTTGAGSTTGLIVVYTLASK